MSCQKRRRAAQMANVRNISDAALSAIVGSLSEEPLEVGSGWTRKSIAKHTEREVMTPTPYGASIGTIPLHTPEGVWDWHVVNIFAPLSYLCTASPNFCELLRTTAARSPPSPQQPWTLIACMDEAAPGNVLSVDMSRKVCLYYLSFSGIRFASSVARGCLVRWRVRQVQARNASRRWHLSDVSRIAEQMVQR